MTSLSRKVACRWLEAKASPVLTRDFQKALDDYKEGNPDPIRAFVQRVVDIIFPNGATATWFPGLGTAKRNTLKGLHSEGVDLLSRLSPLQKVHDPEKWNPYMVMNLERWSKGLRTLEIAMLAEDSERVLSVGNFKVTPMPGVTKAKTTAALEALQTATQKVQARFPEVVYGEVYLSTHLSKNAAAWYVYAKDALYLDVNAKNRFSDVFTILHELGHRYDHKFLSKPLRTKFWELSTRKVFEKVLFDKKLRDSVANEILDAVKAHKAGKPMPRLSPEALLWIQAIHTPGVEASRLSKEYMQDRISEADFLKELSGNEDATVETDKVLHDPLSVSDYGATKPAENFAESFAMYVLGMDFHPELKAILDEAR